MTTASAPARSRVTHWVTGAAIVAVTAALAAGLDALEPRVGRLLPDYTEVQGHVFADVIGFLRWVLGDTTEAVFFKSALGGIGMIAGAWIAHLAWRRGRRLGFPLAAGTGLFPSMFAAAALGLVLSNLLWGWTVPASGGWQPTFVAFVAVPAAVVLVYGAGWRVAVTGAVLGAVLNTPVALVVVNYFCLPLDLPTVIGNVTGMWGGALLAFLLCRRLPWLRRPAPADPPADDPQPAPERHGPVWMVRRVLADFTEAPFYGNEIASIGLLLGTVLAFLLNPANPVYGDGVLPAMLTAQVATSTLGVLLYRSRWIARGWYPTFVPVVSVAPATVLTYGAGVHTVVAGAVVGALIGPPVAAWISERLPSDFHPFIGNVVSMAVGTLVAVPVLGLLPGFG